MDSIRLVTSLPPVATVDPPARVIGALNSSSSSDRKLDPAVSVDLSPDAGQARKADTESRGFERDLDSNAVVYRVTDTISGDIIVQIPNEIVIKARVYGRQQNPPTGELIAKSA